MAPEQPPTLLGDSRVMRAVRENIARVAPYHVPVFTHGESGTGKGEAARLIHQLSGRPGQFVEISSPRLKSGIAESVLYGHARGSFTGAIKEFMGNWALAHQGSFLLNEVHRLKRMGQGLLLELLDGRAYHGVGGERERRPDVRLIVGSACSKRALFEQGLDPHLLYRFGSISIEFPPLRERMEDLELLLAYSMERLGRERRIPAKQWEPEALELLRAFQWPGNVRQLLNVVEATLILAPSKTVESSLVASVLADEMGELSLTAASDKVHRTREAVRLSGTQEMAARLLGVSTKTVSRRLRRSLTVQGSEHP